MCPGTEVRLGIDRLVPGGDGCGTSDGLTVFVPYAAPGDILSVCITEVRKHYARARIVDILESSQDRVVPVCPLYGRCGGCNLMHLSCTAQRAARQAIWWDAMRRIGGFSGADADPDAGSVHGARAFGDARGHFSLDMRASPALGYRSRAQFHLDQDGMIGYAARGSSTILPVTDCPVLVEALNEWLALANTQSDALKRHGPLLAERGRFIVFGLPDDAGFADADDRSIADADTDTVGRSRGVWIEGLDKAVRIHIGGKPFSFSISGFFQSNLMMLEPLISSVVAGMSGRTAADLYCGVGLFGAFLRDSFERVVCVEQDAEALGHAFHNVGRDADFAVSGLAEWTRTVQAGQTFDYVVVDPPRAGLAPAVRDWISRQHPSVIGYVSCNPVSLARDAGCLVAAGYVVDHAILFDFYPQTEHVESYVRFCLA
jgi:23S rRNA (uracil1939-C5)-methyltransferase